MCKVEILMRRNYNSKSYNLRWRYYDLHDCAEAARTPCDALQAQRRACKALRSETCIVHLCDMSIGIILVYMFVMIVMFMM